MIRPTSVAISIVLPSITSSKRIVFVVVVDRSKATTLALYLSAYGQTRTEMEAKWEVFDGLQKQQKKTNSSTYRLMF